jgi:hypothetical protein
MRLDGSDLLFAVGQLYHYAPWFQAEALSNSQPPNAQF